MAMIKRGEPLSSLFSLLASIIRMPPGRQAVSRIKLPATVDRIKPSPMTFIRTQGFSSGDAVAGFDQQWITTETSPTSDGLGRIDDDASSDMNGPRTRSLESTLPADALSTSNISISQKLVGGMDVGELIAQLEAHGGGRVHLEDLQGFMLKAVLPMEPLAATTNGDINDVGPQKPHLEEPLQQRVGKSKEEGTVRPTSSDIIALAVGSVEEQSNDTSQPDFQSDSHPSGQNENVAGLEQWVNMSANESPSAASQGREVGTIDANRAQSRKIPRQLDSRASLGKFHLNAKSTIDGQIPRELVGGSTSDQGATNYRSEDNPRSKTKKIFEYHMARKLTSEAALPASNVLAKSKKSSLYGDDYNVTVTERDSVQSILNRFETRILQSLRSTQAPDASHSASNVEDAAGNGAADSATGEGSKEGTALVPKHAKVCATEQVDEQAPQSITKKILKYHIARKSANAAALPASDVLSHPTKSFLYDDVTDSLVIERDSAQSMLKRFEARILQSPRTTRASHDSLSGSSDEDSAGNGAADSATREWTKQRPAPVPNDVEVGAIKVDEQAPQSNANKILEYHMMRKLASAAALPASGVLSHPRKSPLYEDAYDSTVIKRESAQSTLSRFETHILQGQRSTRATNTLSGSSSDDSAGNGAKDSATSDWTKQRTILVPKDVEVGAIQMGEQAPQLNRRFYLGLDRRPRRARRQRRSGVPVLRGQRTEYVTAGEGPGRRRRSGANFHAQSTRRFFSFMSFFSHANSDPDNDRSQRTGRILALLSSTLSRGRSTVQSFIIRAHLVEETEGEVVIAEPVGFFETKWKRIASCVFVFLVIAVISFSLVLNNEANTPSENASSIPREDALSMQPSSRPSFDPRPTLETVQTRGRVRCGLRKQKYSLESGESLRVDLCRAVAAVLFGNPNNIEGVPVTDSTRFRQLSDKTIDVLINGDTRTVEREVRERTTGAGFAFSSTYYYDGMAYFGDETFVGCAEKQKRYNECSSLRICPYQGTTGYDFVQSSFPSDFYQGGSSDDEITEMLLNDTCNVIAADRSILLQIESNIDSSDRNLVVGDKLMTKEPLAIVTRNDDAEFSDIINWVVQSLFYGEEQSLTKDMSKCQDYTNLTAHDVSNLIFSNAFYCVGNYGEILGARYQNNRGMNQINNGTTGMLYAIPFGELEHNGGVLADNDPTDDHVLLSHVRNEGSLNCGVVVPDGFTGVVTSRNKLVGMSVDYCRTLAAALFNGNFKAVKILAFSGEENKAFVALNNGTIDVLAGVRIGQEYDIGSSSARGFHFSMPYYYGDETTIEDVSFYSLVTHDDNALFSSFVNCVVLATIFVEEKIRKKESTEMPMVSAFGSEFSWALRDAMDYIGSYDQIYVKNFGDILEEKRARNLLNDAGTPQIHSFPGTRQWQERSTMK